jgi:lipopolysaccharide exporter
MSTRGSWRFTSDVLKVASGTAIAQVITVAVAPLLARLFPPEAFGVAALFASVIAVAGAFACLCYEQAIVLSSDEEDAANLLALCIGLACVSALTFAAILWIARPVIATWSSASDLVALLWLLPVATLMQGSLNAMYLWNTRARRFRQLSASQVANQLTASSLNVAGGVAGHTGGATMIYASVAGQGASLTVLAARLFRDQRSMLRRCIRLDRVMDQLKRHRKFPLYTSWSALLNSASWQLPVLMLGALFSPAIVGFYALGFRVLQLPMSLVARSIGQVFLQRAAVAHREGNLAPLVKELFQKLFIVGLLPCLVLTIVGQELFELVFGLEWSEAGVYVQLLAPWVLVWFVSSPLASLYYVLGRQREDLFLQGVIVSTRIVAIGIGGLIGDARLAVLLFACSGVFAYSYLVRMIFLFVQLDARTVFSACIGPLRDALLLGGGLLALKLGGAHTLILVGACVAALATFGFRHHRLMRPS